MISVSDSDCDVLRFLWVDDINKKEPELKVFRFTRVVFGVSSSPFLLNATIRFHLERYMESDTSTVQTLLQSTYVNDIITRAESAFHHVHLSEGHISCLSVQPKEVCHKLFKFATDRLCDPVQKLSYSVPKLLLELENLETTKYWEFPGIQGRLSVVSCIRPGPTGL